MSRGTQAPAPARVASNGGSASSNGNGKKSSHWSGSPQWLRIVWMVLLFGVTLLVVGVALLIYFGGAKEQNFVDKNKEQAVFLTSGQVYFGKIKTISKDYVNLQQIYYLNVNQQVQPNQQNGNNSSNNNQSVSLVKLGCELHGPTDQMIINRQQVTFWENLKTDGQVSKAIATWLQQNPNGQTCAQPNSSTNTNTTTKP